MYKLKNLLLFIFSSLTIFSMNINENLLSNDLSFTHAISMYGDIKYGKKFKHFKQISSF